MPFVEADAEQFRLGLVALVPFEAHWFGFAQHFDQLNVNDRKKQQSYGQRDQSNPGRPGRPNGDAGERGGDTCRTGKKIIGAVPDN